MINITFDKIVWLNRLHSQQWLNIIYYKITVYESINAWITKQEYMEEYVAKHESTVEQFAAEKSSKMEELSKSEIQSASFRVIPISHFGGHLLWYLRRYAQIDSVMTN